MRTKPNLRPWAAALALCLSAAVLTACGDEDKAPRESLPDGPAVSGDPYLIGNLMEIETPFGTYPPSYQGTVRAWQDWTNASGGINGRPVEVISVDTQADAAKSLSAAKRLVEEEGVIAFAGLVNPTSETAYEDYLADAGIPVVGSAYSTIADKNPNWFQTAPASYEVAGYSRALAAKEAGVTRYGLMYCTEVPACKVDIDEQTAAADALGSPEVVTTLSAQIAAPNFTSACVKMKSEDVDGIYFSASVEGIARAAVDCARQQIKAVHVMGESGPALLETSQVWENGAAGADMSMPYWAEVPESEEYRKAMNAAGFDELSAASAQVWGAFEVLKAALEQVPDEADSPATVKKGLYALPDGYKADMAVPVHFKEGQVSIADCFYLWKIEDGKYSLSHGDEPTCMAS